MIRCTQCQHELPDNSRFCGYCGAKVETNSESASPSIKDNETMSDMPVTG
ncbi:MAG: zinc-ribbon domain-containing protein, partial [Proteobacteria bacterium]|nr:zinc-ribbon domain-containing protein [Pseudomonadota bacterium]